MQSFKLLFLTICACVSTSYAEACSRRPLEISLEEYLNRLRKPHFADLVRSAATIDLAVAVAHKKTERPEKWRKNSDTPPNVRKSRYFFEVTERLKGASEPTFEYKSQDPGMNYQAAPFYREGEVLLDDAQKPAKDFVQPVDPRHRDWDFWKYGDTEIGHETDPGDCFTYVEFIIGETYLVVKDESGAFLSAEKITHPDDAWLAAVRNLIADPKRDYGYEVSLKTYLRMAPTRYEFNIVRCEPLEYSVFMFSENHRLLPLVEENGPWRRRFDPVHDGPIVVSDYPVSNQQCRIGARYLTNSFEQYGEVWAINDDNMVDLTNIAGQLLVTGKRRVPLEDVRLWMEEYRRK